MTLFRASPETELLVRRLREAKANGEPRISYDELSRIANTDVQADRGYGFLRTARLRVQEEDQDVWACERGRGLYLTSDVEKAGIGEVSAKKVRRQVHRDKKVLRTVDVTKLKTTAEQDKFNISAARLAILGLASSRKMGNRLTTNIEETRQLAEEKIGLPKALDLMRGAYPNRSNPAKQREPEDEGESQQTPPQTDS